MKKFELILKATFYAGALSGWFLIAIRFHTPEWATWMAIAIVSAVLYEIHEMKSALKREIARIQCELSGHCGTEFEKKTDDTAYCLRCKDPVRTRAPGSNGPGMQYGEDTLHQRICRVERALGLED